MKIGIDIDDTIMPYFRNYVEFSNVFYGTNLNIKDFFVPDLGSVIKAGRDEVFDRLSRFHRSIFYESRVPFEDSQDVLEELSKENELITITRRYIEWENETKIDLDNHFRQIFKESIFASNYNDRSKNRDKLDICREKGIEVMIDDSLDTAKKFSGNLPYILFGDHPWTVDKKLNGVYHAKNWKEIPKIISSLDRYL